MNTANHKLANFHESIAANGIKPFYGTGRLVRLIACTGKPSVWVGLDDDPLTLWYPGKGVDCGNNPVSKVVVSNVGAGAAAIELEISDTYTLDDRGASALIGIATNIAAMAARLAGVATMTQGTLQTLAATGGAGDLVLAASATRRHVIIEAAMDNTGTVYLGNTAAHCADTDCFAMLAPGQAWSDEYYQGAIYGVGSDATQKITRSQE